MAWPEEPRGMRGIIYDGVVVVVVVAPVLLLLLLFFYSSRSDDGDFWMS